MKKDDDKIIYAYKARHLKGDRKIVVGEISAKTIMNAKMELYRQQLTIISIIKKSKQKTDKKGKTISQGDVSFMTRQLSTMFAAGLPLVQSLGVIADGHDNPTFKRLMYDIKDDIEQGDSFSIALRRHPLIFDELYCSLVESGEESGVLDGLLDKIAIYKEKAEIIKTKIKKAMTYPIAVIVVSMIVTTILLVKVVPVFDDMFKGFGSELPSFTQMVVDMSEWMQSSWYYLLFIFLGTYYACANIYKRSKMVRDRVDEILLVAPIVGDIIHKASLARYARTLATMSSAGVPLMEALTSVGGAAGNVVFFRAVKSIKSDVAGGGTLSSAMAKFPIFTPISIQMTAIGEESGSLSDMLEKVADIYEREVDDAVDNLTALIEPIVMVVLGIIVGGLIIAMYLPIFKMGGAI